MPPRPTLVSAAAFFDRLTEAEADALDEAMQKLGIKFRGAWNAIVSGGELRSDRDVWSVLNREIVELFGVDRADALLVSAS